MKEKGSVCVSCVVEEEREKKNREERVEEHDNTTHALARCEPLLRLVHVIHMVTVAKTIESSLLTAGVAMFLCRLYNFKNASSTLAYHSGTLWTICT